MLESTEKIKYKRLTDSKPMMIEFLIQSKRISYLNNVLHELDIYSIQILFDNVFNVHERNYLLANWLKLNITELLRTKSEHEALPIDWFRDK
jgi:hypothetical protein